MFLFYFICFGFTGQKVVGVILEDGTKVTADAVVLTTGTFLRGVIQIGACGLRLLACSILCIYCGLKVQTLHASVLSLWDT